MTSILRQSSSLARVSKCSLQSSVVAARSSFLRPSSASKVLGRTRIATQQTRAYADAPKKEKENYNNTNNGTKKNAEGKEVVEEAVKKKGKKEGDDSTPEPKAKAAPGTENLYDGEKATPLSPNPEAKAEDEASQPPADAKVKISPEEEEAMQALFETLKKGLPKTQIAYVERTFEAIKREGMTREFKELMDDVKGKPLTLGTAAKVMRLTTKLARRETERQLYGSGEKGKEEGVDFKGNETKGADGEGAGSPPPPPPGGKEKRKSGGEGRKQREWKMPDLSSVLVSVFVSWLFYNMVMPGENRRDITWQEFRNAFLDKGLVEKLTVINGGRIRVDLHREATQSMYPDSPAVNSNFHYYFSIGSVEAFERKLEDAQKELGIPGSERIPVSYASDSDIWTILMNFGPTLLFIGAIFYMSRRASAGGASSSIFSMGKSRAKQFNHETEVKIKFKDVAGMDEAKAEIMEFVAFLKTPEQFQRLGAKIPRGAILSGPPGTGKTLLAKATAGESQVPFFSVSGSEFVEMFVGVGASRVRDLFAMARKSTPCIIFIDEIDAIGKARGKAGSFGGGNDEREATLNQILTEMDGFNTAEQVVVLAGTNRPDVLDKALMRPGRFDRHIAIDRPTMEGRKQIFMVHLGKIVTNEDLEYLTGRLSALTPGFSGADIANCVNEAALIGKTLYSIMGFHYC